MLEKLILFVLQAKHLAIVGVVATGVVITGTIGGQAVDLVIKPLVSPPALAYPSDPLVDVDEPVVGGRINGDVDVTGFAIDRNATTGTGIQDVKIYLDGTTELLGTATYGADRDAVAEEFGEQFKPSGWTFTWAAGDLEGNRTLHIVARATDGRTSVVTREVNDPLVRFELPAAEAKVKGPVDVTGWAIDRTDEEGNGISKVTLYLDGTDESNQLGDATLGVESPDLVELYGERFGDAGWIFGWDTTDVEPGMHTLYAVATSSVSGHTTTASREVRVQEDEENDTSAGPGCSEWAHDRNAAWALVQSAWKSARAELDELRVTGKQQGKSEISAVLRSARSTTDAKRGTAHLDLQALAHGDHCNADLDYTTIVETFATDMETATTEAKADVEALAAETTTTSKGKPGKGPNQ